MDVTTNFGTVKIKMLKGEQGEQGLQGEQGIQGIQGEPFEFEDFTEEQLAELRADVASVYYKKDEATYHTVGEDTTTIEIPIESYTDHDMLLVDVEGLALTENVDYTIDGSTIVLTEPITHHWTAVNFRALRAIAITAEDYDALKGDNGSFDDLTEAQKEELASLAAASAMPELQVSIDAEASARADADTALAGQIGSEASARADADRALASQISTMQGAIGAPLVAATASAMTDTTKIYVYTGSESGYVNGNWYYYSGSAWVSGGVYNSSAVNTDKTLTASDMPADSNAVGMRIGDIDTAFTGLYKVGERKSPSGTAPNYKLVQSGSSTSDSNYQILKYYVTAGQEYWLRVAGNGGVTFQYQNAWNVPTGANTGLVGVPRSFAYDGIIKVPSGASYVMVSVLKTDTTSGLYNYSSDFSYMNKDSQVSFIGESSLYLEKDVTNSLLYVYAGSWYLRSSFSKTVTLSEMQSSVGLSTSPSGVTNCVAIPFGQSLYMSLVDYSIGIASSYAAYDGARSVLLAYVSTSGNLLAGAMYHRYLYERIDSSSHDGITIPEYFESQIASKASSINANIAGGGRQGFTMAFVTDSHLGYNSGNTPALVRYLNEHTNMKYVFNGGDIIDVEQTKTLALDKMAEYVGGFSFLNHPMFTVMGNHDYNTETSSAVEGENVIISEFYGAAMRQMDGVTYFDDYYDYYFTDKDSGTSVVCLQTGVHNGSYHVNQNDALAEILPTLGENVIIIGHLFCRTIDGTPTLNANFNTLMNGNSLHQGLKDMTGKDKVKCIVTGHTHCDYTEVVNGIRVIVTDTDSYKPNTAYRGTTDELAFDVMSFEFENDVVRCVRVGRGDDRTLSLS